MTRRIIVPLTEPITIKLVDLPTIDEYQAFMVAKDAKSEPPTPQVASRSSRASN